MRYTDRRDFLTTLAATLLVPGTLLGAEGQAPPTDIDTTGVNTSAGRDLNKIITELPHAIPHLARIKAACDKYKEIHPLPMVFPAKIQAIESGYNTDAISGSFAVGGAQFMHYTARDLGATLPPEEAFKDQDDVLSLRRRYGRHIGNAVEAFRDGDDIRARNLRDEAETLKTRLDKAFDATMDAFKKKMFAMTPEERRAYDQRFDPPASDDMLVHYLAKLARSIKRTMDLEREEDILLLAGVAYNAGVGRVTRKPGIPVVGESVEYANKLMLFQSVKL